jgi:nitrite reductase/ring-hydroxylating ferredoxin subunit
MSDRFVDRFVMKLGRDAYRVQGQCPHRGGLLRMGTINDERGVIIWPLHFATFDVRTGLH